MSSYDKVVKLACKPKAAPPKAKYLDPIIAATWSEDGAVHDVCKALSPRFREPNAIIVFKALIVLHTMIRNGATDNVLAYLSSSEVLRLQNVSTGNWEGYAAPQNLQNYAIYLDSRIRAYHDLKHDAVRVQAESNRDLRNTNSIEEDGYRVRNSGGGSSKPSSSVPSRSKTITGRKLRVMTVEKGLLRETKAVHRMVDSLVECRFYLDDLEDELTTTALRMLVKDLLILFQAGNEGVINVLEHYFEMSHVDAQQALTIYRHFCKQTERVVEYLGVAKKLQNLLNVPIPNLKHAPVSLAGALQEYLDDPNFEQNRIEYKTNKETTERGSKKGGSSSKSKKAEKSSVPKSAPPMPTMPSPPPTAATAAAPITSNAKADTGGQTVVDFFSAIEEEQPTMFNPQTNSPNTAYFHQQGASNPFVQRQMATGQPFVQQPPQTQAQSTGYLMPQQTAFQQPPNPFGLYPPQQHPQQTGHRPFSSFLQPQPQQHAQQTGFLQPQPTGSNPFRQSMLFPQSTGVAMFGVGGLGNLNSPQQAQGQGQAGPLGINMSSPSTAAGSAFSSSTSFPSPFTQPPSSTFSTSPNLPTRPASTPLTSSSLSSSPPLQPVKSHQTGTRNPFGPVAALPPPVPKQPTLMELVMGIGGNNDTGNNGTEKGQPQQTGAFNGLNGFGFNSGALSPGATDISSVASSFAFTKNNGNIKDNKPSASGFSPSNILNAQNTSTTTTGSTFSDSMFSPTLSTQPTGVTSTSSAPSITVSPILKPQSTGFGGIKPFKPSSSFGASLLGTLPSIPGSSPTTPAVTGNGNNTTSPGNGEMFSPTSAGGFGFNTPQTGFGAVNSPPMSATSGGGSTLGQGLRPQMTGGAANPFRASMMGAPAGGPGFGGVPPFSGAGQSTLSSPFAGITGASGSGASTPFGANLFAGSGGALGPSFGPGGQPAQVQQQKSSLSLI